MAVNDPLQVPLGVCDVYFNERKMGFTIGGVEYVYTPEYHETKVDQITGVIERFLIGEKVSAKVPLAETILTNLKDAIAHATDNTSSLTFGSKTGKRASSVAHLLRLHPQEFADEDDRFDVRIYKAHSTGEITLGFKTDGERIAEVMFEGLADTSRSDGNMLGMIGDSI